MEFVPVALACGHLVEGAAIYSVPAADDPEATMLVECPEGCGFVEYVVEPGESGGCLCQPGRHVCGGVTTVSIDLGDLDGGDQIELDW